MLPKYSMCGTKKEANKATICVRGHFPFTGFCGIPSTSPMSPLKIVPWFINLSDHLQFSQHHLNQSPFAFILIYHACPIPHHCSTFSSSSEIVPFNSISNTSILHSILESSFLTMMLKWHHIHPISKILNFYSLEFDLANGIWCILKDLSRSIHEAMDPTINLFKTLPSYINLTCLCELFPRILQTKNFSQNMLLCATICEEIHQLFAMTQTIRIETLQWIAEAKRQCAIIGRVHGWHWVVDERVNSDQFPALEGQLLLSDTALEPSNCNALILYPLFST